MGKVLELHYYSIGMIETAGAFDLNYAIEGM